MQERKCKSARADWRLRAPLHLRENYQEKLHNKFNLCKATTKAEIYKFLNLVTTAYGVKCVPELLRLVWGENLPGTKLLQIQPGDFQFQFSIKSKACTCFVNCPI